MTDSPGVENKDWGSSVRMILQGLILAGVLWVGSSINSQNVSIAKLQVQVDAVQTMLAGIPDLNNRVSKLESNQADLLRRQNNVEAWRDRLQEGDPKLKGWTR